MEKKNKEIWQGYDNKLTIVCLIDSDDNLV